MYVNVITLFPSLPFLLYYPIISSFLYLLLKVATKLNTNTTIVFTNTTSSTSLESLQLFGTLEPSFHHLQRGAHLLHLLLLFFLYSFILFSAAFVEFRYLLAYFLFPFLSLAPTSVEAS